MAGIINGKLADLMKTVGIIFALAAPVVTFYTITKVQLAQQEIRLSDAERRLNLVEQSQQDKIERIFNKIDQTNKDVSEIKNSVVRLQTLIDRH